MRYVREDNEPTIYVLWHPDCKIGQELAEAIYDWFRPELGRGINVYFRCRLWEQDPKTGQDQPNDEETGKKTTATAWRQKFDIPEISQTLKFFATVPEVPIQFLIPLIDANMVVDENWREVLSALSAKPGKSEEAGALSAKSEKANEDERQRTPFVIPVALDYTAFNIGGAVSELNFVRPADLDKAVFQKWSDGELRDDEKTRGRVKRSLLKQITETLCDHMLFWKDQATGSAKYVSHEKRSAEVGPKIKVFLSHAKIDGKSPAKKLRDYIYGQTQLAAFYDENDIPAASNFSRVLKYTLEHGDTAAFVAIRSQAYSKSPWCRREIQLFRCPTRVDAKGRGQEPASHWRMNPVLVVDALRDGDVTSGVPEVGNAAIVRWSDLEPDHEEKIVSMLMRDVLLGAFYVLTGAQIKAGGGSVVINWIPDPTSLLRLKDVMRAEAEKSAQVHGNKKRATSQTKPTDFNEVIYPGLGLSNVELRVLESFFHKMKFSTFEEASEAKTTPSFAEVRTEEKLEQVALFISCEEEELLKFGYARAHLLELIAAIARPLMRADIDVAHCAHWKRKGEGDNQKFVKELLELASNESNEGNGSGSSGETDSPKQDKKSANGTGSSPQSESPKRYTEGRLILYTSWPYFQGIDSLTEAEWIKCCSVIRVDQEAVKIPSNKQVEGKVSSLFSDQAVFNTAQAISMMRRWAVLGVRKSEEYCRDGRGIVVRTGAVVIFGGKLTEFAGKMPSVFEEALFALLYNVPLFILGGFGGAAKVLADAVLNDKSSWASTDVDGDFAEVTRLDNVLSFDWHVRHSTRLARTSRYLDEERDQEALTAGDTDLKAVPKSIAIREQYQCLNCLLEKKHGISLSHAGLSSDDEGELMTTRDMKRAAELVLKGLAKLDRGK